MTLRIAAIRLLAVAFGLTLLMLAGCSSTISVNYDYDTTTNFGAYRTFDWAPDPADATQPLDAAQATTRNGLLSNRIKASVDSEMATKGFTKSSANPELLVVFHLGVQDKIQVSDWGYGYSGRYWGGYGGYYGGTGMDVYQYQEGRMIIDIVDASTHDLIWRGTGEGVVGSGQKSPEEVQYKIDTVVNQIMANFPPPIK